MPRIDLQRSHPNAPMVHLIHAIPGENLSVHFTGFTEEDSSPSISGAPIKEPNEEKVCLWNGSIRSRFLPILLRSEVSLAIPKSRGSRSEATVSSLTSEGAAWIGKVVKVHSNLVRNQPRSRKGILALLVCARASLPDPFSIV